MGIDNGKTWEQVDDPSLTPDYKKTYDSWEEAENPRGSYEACVVDVKKIIAGILKPLFDGSDVALDWIDQLIEMKLGEYFKVRQLQGFAINQWAVFAPNYNKNGSIVMGLNNRPLLKATPVSREIILRGIADEIIKTIWQTALNDKIIAIIQSVMVIDGSIYGSDDDIDNDDPIALVEYRIFNSIKILIRGFIERYYADSASMPCKNEIVGWIKGINQFANQSNEGSRSWYNLVYRYLRDLENGKLEGIAKEKFIAMIDRLYKEITLVEIDVEVELG